MRSCEFCGRYSKRRFCSSICKDAWDAGELKPHESIVGNQLCDYIRLQINKPELRGWMRKKHLTLH
jgi:hypothetical protein